MSGSVDLYAVEISDPALAEIEAQYVWLRRRTAQYSGEWLAEIYEKMDSLTLFPKAHPIAEESDQYGLELWKVPVGQQVILFSVDDVEKKVRIFAVRGGGKRVF